MGTIVTPEILDFYNEDSDSGEGVSQALIFKMMKAMQGLKVGNTEALGSLEISFIPESNFQALKSNTFIACDGRNITSTDYGQYLISVGLASGTVYAPDLRGMHLVGVNNGRSDGNQHHKNPTLGGFVSGDIKGHNHSMRERISQNSPNQTGNMLKYQSDAYEYNSQNQTTKNVSGIINSTGQSQNTVNAVGVNYYIKVWNVPQ
tara:strand:+ start:2230 stop:2841 length:612 start_codon:yes stop_codon:yes gene_type:complete